MSGHAKRPGRNISLNHLDIHTPIIVLVDRKGPRVRLERVLMEIPDVALTIPHALEVHALDAGHGVYAAATEVDLQAGDILHQRFAGEGDPGLFMSLLAVAVMLLVT